MFLMMLCICFNYTILRDTKDTIVVTTSGSEVIPFLKFWGVLPAAVLFMLIYSKMSNMFSKEKLFYVTLFPFMIFFALFPVLIYPFRDVLHPHASADYFQSVLPEGFNGLVACYRNWTFSLFYILSELWGSAVLSLMFWGFANDIIKVTEAKRVYTFFGMGANVALLISGPAIIYFSDIRKHLPPDVDAWQITLSYLCGMVVIACLLIYFIYWWIQRNVLTDPRFYDPTQQAKVKKSKPKMSIGESFTFLAKSPYILCIALLVIGYGIAINLVEVTWKGQIKLQYPNANDYSTFMGRFSTIGGAVNISMMFIGGWIIRTFGWGVAAMLTPLMLLATGIGFFAFVLFSGSEMLQGFVAYFGTTTVMMAVVLGMIQNLASKSTKYSLFDPTKEMAYIPLDQESKVKGKAAIDVVGARLGKSGGSLIQQILIVIFGTVTAIAPYIAVIMVIVIVAWLFAVRSLNKQFVALTGESVSKPKEAPAT
jgi:AAA family ATP:ADP antiporter